MAGSSIVFENGEEFARALLANPTKQFLAAIVLEASEVVQAERDQLLAQAGQFRRGPVGGQYQLPPLAQQGLDGVLNFHQRRPLAAKEMHVVDQQHIDLAVLAAKAGQPAALQGFEKQAGELLGRK